MPHFTKRTRAIEDEVVSRLSNGEPLRAICRDEHMPSWCAIYDWINADPDFEKRIARARDLGFDAIAEDALNIADTTQEGVRTEIGDDGKVKEVREDMLGHRKLRIETRLKLLAKWSPRYREQQKIEMSGGTKDQLRIVSEFDDGNDLV